MANAADPYIREKFIVAKLSKAQLNGLLATARSEVVRTYTGRCTPSPDPWAAKRYGVSCGLV
jgi:hypothetical protein